MAQRAGPCTTLQRVATVATPAEDPTPSQLVAIAALVAGATNTTAAEAAGVDRSTLFRWLKGDAEFVAALNLARSEQAERTRAELRGLASEAVATIRELMTSPQTPPAIRLRAAATALEIAGGTGPESHGPTEPDEVRAMWEADEEAQKHGELLKSFSPAALLTRRRPGL